MRNRIARVFGAALMLFLPTASIAENAAPQATPALWRVQHGTSTVYLFGSLHVLPTDYVWTTPQIQAAMEASDVFLFEVPVDEAAIKDEREFILKNGILPKRQSLRSILSQNEFDTYSAVLRRAGLKPEQFERYRPWLAAIMVGLGYLHNDDLTSLKGADDKIMDFARTHGRKLLYLESMREQMALLTSGDESSQVKSLKNLIRSLPRSRDQEKEMVETWSSGDADRFTALLERYFNGRPDAQDALINVRNRNWIPAIKQLLARPGGITMMTVGAAHIGGRKGLIALLCGEGYEVERVADRQAAGETACGPEA